MVMKKTAGAGYRVGVLLVLTAAITYSTAGLFTKGVNAGSWDVIFWRAVFAAAFTIGWTLKSHTFKQNFLAMGQSGWAVGVIGALGTAAFIPAFKLTTIANVSLIYAVAPVIAALLAWIVIGERASARTIIGCFFAILGVAIIVSGSLGGVSLIGDMLAMGMTVAMASIMVIYRTFPKTPGAGPAVLQSAFLLPFASMFGNPFSVAPTEIAILAAFGFLFAIASVTLAEGAKRIPAGQAALLSSLETPLAPIFAFILFVEIPNVATCLGGTIVLLAVTLSIGNDDAQHDDNPCDHEPSHGR
ncbi:MAG: DMT family transporter [Pseudomonadota bacterium]